MGDAGDANLFFFAAFRPWEPRGCRGSTATPWVGHKLSAGPSKTTRHVKKSESSSDMKKNGATHGDSSYDMGVSENG